MERDALVKKIGDFQQKLAGFSIRGFTKDNQDLNRDYCELINRLTAHKGKVDKEITHLIEQLPDPTEIEVALTQINKAKKNKRLRLPLFYGTVAIVVLLCTFLLLLGASDFLKLLIGPVVFGAIALSLIMFRRVGVKYDDSFDLIAKTENHTLVQIYLKLSEKGTKPNNG